MNRVVPIILVLLLLGSFVSAVEGVLIDFNEIIADYEGQHEATIIDYSSLVGERFSDQEKAAMRSSLLIPNWSVELSSSSRSVVNDSLSYVQPTTVKDSSELYPGMQVMAIRVHYPEGAFNSYARVVPPFEIPAYSTNPVADNPPVGVQFSGFGVLKNVGSIKTVKANVYGLNHPISMEVVIRDPMRQTMRIPLGDLQFDGWSNLIWNNPAYVNDVRRRELFSMPLYPHVASDIVLDSIQFYRDASLPGGDFIVYVKDIKVDYDQAVLEEVDTDFSHEEVWGILRDRSTRRMEVELSRLSDLQVLRYIEEQKKHKDEE